MALRSVRCNKERFPVIRELEACPVGFRLGFLLGGEVGAHVEGCEGGLVVVAEVVEEDALRTCGGYCYDCC